MRSSSLRFLPLWCLPLVFASCRETAPSSDELREPAAKSDARDHSMVLFWEDFRAALRKKDAAAIARMTRFPVEVGIAEIEGFEDVETRAGFVKHFDTIFPEEARTTLLKGSIEKEDEEEAWSITHIHDKPEGISEGEWAIGYRFERIKGGMIRLVSVEFAG